MESTIKLIKKKILNEIQVSKIEIIDNTRKHSSHKFFQKNKLHLKIIIVSEYLKSLDRVQAHKKIMNVLDEEIKDKIHALELKIL